MGLVEDAKSLLRPVVLKTLDRQSTSRSLSAHRAAFAQFRGPLKEEMAKAGSTPFYEYSGQHHIEGWLSAPERQALYSLARWLPGPFLEIGHWCGKSTVAIARAIEDSGCAKRFDSIDLNPTEAKFVEIDGAIGFVVPGSSAPIGLIPKDGYERDLLPVLRRPGGVQGTLRKNLSSRGLSDLVNIFEGDFKTDLASASYHFVFCDVLHDADEIGVNASALGRFLAPGAILACHDVGRDPELVRLMRGKLPLGHSVTVDSLFIAEFEAS
jgi:predicted O-methyltransferase YrrM